MAGRTSTSFGVAATITILGVLSLGFFVTAAIFYNKTFELQRTVETLQADQVKVVKSDERNREDVLSLVKEAEKERKSLVGYMIDGQASIMARVTGSRRDTVAELTRKLESVKGADTASLLSLVISITPCTRCRTSSSSRVTASSTSPALARKAPALKSMR